ncbi:MAG: sel1 repeat family protein [Candidatus Thiodiazotropha sp. LLP2]
MQLRFTLRHTLLLCAVLSISILTGCASTPDPEVDEIALTLTEAHKAYNIKEYKKVFRLLFPIAAAGNAKAQYALGYLFYHGLGVEKNERQAMHWVQLSAAQGNGKALRALTPAN